MYKDLHQIYSTTADDFSDKDSDWLQSALVTKQLELNSIIRGCKAILEKSNFADAAREIFDQCCHLTGATSGYVALLSDDGSENDVLFLEDGGMECTVDPELPMPIRGLREQSYVGNCAVYHNDFMNSHWVKMMPGGHMTLDNVMFSPLVIDDKTVGIMGMANKSSDFTDRDAEIATVFGELAAIALTNSRSLEDRQKAEEQLSHTVSDLNNAQHIAKIGSWELNLSNHILTWSDEAYRIFGLSPQQFPATYEDFLDNIHPEDRDLVNRAYTESVKSKQPYNITHRLLLSDGTLKYVNERCETLYDEEGTAIRSVGTVQDITASVLEEKQRQELENQLRQKHKMEAVGYMAGGMAHNFNNNLGVILGNVELSLMKQPRNSDVVPLLENAKIAVNRSRDLILKIITYSRQGIQQKAPMHLTTITDETISLVRSTLPSSVDLQTTYGPDCHATLINADASQIQEVLINLCNNAIQAMNEMGELNISLESVELHQREIPAQYDCLPGRYAKLSVQDSGCGMPAEMLDKIFDPFYTTKEDYEGAGMGLSTVQGIVAQHGGIIKVNSIPDQGTVFNLYFPIIEKTYIDESTTENTTLPRGTERILFVDDDEMLASLGEKLLTEMGYQVVVMNESTEALKMFAVNAEHFDLVITDQTMPQLSGKDLIEELKKVKPDIPTILCTGYSSKVDKDHAKELGINAFMMKPLDLIQLAQTVRRVLDGVKVE